jgi:DNA polymerase III subunit epsilon
MLTRLGLRLRIFLLFAALAAGALAALIGGLWFGYAHLQGAGGGAFVQVGVLAGFAILGLIAAIWLLFDTHVAKPIDLLSGALRARAHADIEAPFETETARYLGDLAPAAASAAARLAQASRAISAGIEAETAQLSGENRRLSALLADVPVGVLLCSAQHELAFYNGLARDILRAGGAAGLGRALFDYLHEGPILLAQARLLASGDAEAASDLLCSTRDGGRVLAARMRLLPEGGYVLTLRDVTADLNAHAAREALMAEVLEGLARPSANLSTLMAAQPEGSPLPPQLEAALRQEVQALAQSVPRLALRFEASRREASPLVLTRASDLLDGLQARLAAEGIGLSQTAAPLLLHCNGFEVIGLLSHLAQRQGLTACHATLIEEGADALIRLSWQGAVMAMGDLERWLGQPIDPATPALTGRGVLLSHATEIWPEVEAEVGPKAGAGRSSLCLPLRAARREGPRPMPVSRDVVYDFDLLSKAQGSVASGAKLADLTYVVFDSETTGLHPEQGDELVQLAALRIVNGRLLRSEAFDTLVNPARKIPEAATRVHGITQAMVADAPSPGEALRRFHGFAQGAVLIAHNAPFDMQFLRRREAEIGLRFDHPILDTVLLSALIWGQHETHTLDALCHRLGITIPEEARHTALGDTLATAEAFLKLLPMLQGRGLSDFASLLPELRRHGRLLQDLNKRS